MSRPFVAFWEAFLAINSIGLAWLGLENRVPFCLARYNSCGLDDSASFAGTGQATQAKSAI